MAKAASKRSRSTKPAASRKSPAKSAATKSGATKKSVAKKPAKKKPAGVMEKIVDMVGEVRKNMAKRRKARRAAISEAFSSLTSGGKKKRATRAGSARRAK